MLGSGVRIVRLADRKEEAPMHKLAARTYVNADSTKVVPEGHVDAAYLLGGEGDEVSDETAKRLGLIEAPAEGRSYGSMKVDELKALMVDRGLEIPDGAKKADLVDSLEGADATAETGGTADVETPAE
jgi:hypothetical protein